jgi:hypothetical protein
MQSSLDGVSQSFRKLRIFVEGLGSKKFVNQVQMHDRQAVHCGFEVGDERILLGLFV